MIKHGVSDRHSGVKDLSWKLARVAARTYESVTDLYPAMKEIRKNLQLAEFCDCIMSCAHLYEWANAPSAVRVWNAQALVVEHFATRASFSWVPGEDVFLSGLRVLTENAKLDKAAVALAKARPPGAYQKKATNANKGRSAVVPPVHHVAPASSQGKKKGRKGKRNRNANSQQASGGQQSDMVCFHCGDSGHTANNCPVKKRGEAARKEKRGKKN